MLWDTINHLAMGQTIGRALAHAKDTYGENDIIWYTEHTAGVDRVDVVHIAQHSPCAARQQRFGHRLIHAVREDVYKRQR